MRILSGKILFSLILPLTLMGVDVAYAQQTNTNYVRDRLGSTRAVVTEQGVPLQATDYYPSGIPVETYSTGNAYNTTDRLHTGKEFHAFDGLSWHDNAARFHDALFPRFTTVDPLAEQDPATSPYAYCGNNPLRFIDPTGEKILINDTDYAGYHSNCNDDMFVKEMAGILDMIRQSGGEEAVNDLMESNTNYIFLPTDESKSYTYASSDGNGNPIGDVQMFVRNTGVPGVLANDSAHELFHSVQYENGQGGETVFNEVEAYAFQHIILENAYLSEKGVKSSVSSTICPNLVDILLEFGEGDYSNQSKAVLLFKNSDIGQKQGYYGIPLYNKSNTNLLELYNIKNL